MDLTLKRLISAFHVPSLLDDAMQQMMSMFQQQTDESIALFVTQTSPWLGQLEQKVWQVLSLNSTEWLNQTNSFEFFQTLASLNKKMIFNQNNIEDDMKLTLLMPDTPDQINHLFQQIEQTNDHNDSFIDIISLWFDNLAFFVHEYPRFGHLPITIHINQYLGHHVIMSEEFKSYLTQLHQSPSIFTAKQIFYLKTCPFFLNAYFYCNPQTSNYTPETVLEHIREDYLQMIQVQSCNVDLWSKDLLSCVTHLIGFLRAFLWWDGENGVKLKLLFPTEKVLCDYIQALVRIISHKPFYTSIAKQWSNDETILMDSILLFLMNIVHTQNVNWFFRSLTQLPSILLNLAELNGYYRIYLCAYGILSEILTDEHLKELKFTSNIKTLFFDMFEQAWRDTSKKYKQIPIIYFLKGFLNLSKNDLIQQETAMLNEISLFIEMCDQYPIVFDIIWGLSFNPTIQQQLRTSSTFMSKLAYLAKESVNEQMRKALHGILWNLEINHEDRAITEINNGQAFDVMISYSHKDKTLAQQIYDELIKGGYRVWIDFDQMHGNVMDAMAQAIEQSQTVIICMSEQYRNSNYCRAEAQYAFQRQRKIVPALLQKHYKPDGWLLFLIGQLLYVDFNKYEFSRAVKMLFKELQVEGCVKTNELPVAPIEDPNVIPSEVPVVCSPRVSGSSRASHNVLEWTEEQVQEWLLKHNLVQMSCLLIKCDGRSLVYLSKYMKSCQPQQILNLLQEDALQRTKQNVSLIEVACFHSLMDHVKHPLRSMEAKANIEKKDF